MISVRFFVKLIYLIIIFVYSMLFAEYIDDPNK